MQLTVHAILNRQCYKAGEEVPDAEVPEALLKWAVKREDREQSNGDEVVSEQTSTPKRRPKPDAFTRYVRRANAFLRTNEVRCVPGEKKYRRIGNGFVLVGRIKAEDLA